MKKTGLMIYLGVSLALSGCASKTQAETVQPTTEIQATAVDIGNGETMVAEIYESNTSDDSWSGKLENGDVIADMGKYGEFGKEAYNVLVEYWMGWLVADETELRESATACLGAISKENYEAIIAEIVAMDRGTKPSQPAPTQAPAPAETQAPTQAPASTKAPAASDTPAPTKDPAPTQAPTQAPQSSNNTSNGFSQEEIDKNREWEASLGGQVQGGVVDKVTIDENGGNYNWD